MPTVVNWIKANRLKAHKTPGGHRRISRDELASFIRRHGMPMPQELDGETDSTKILIVHEEEAQAEQIAVHIKRAGFEPIIICDGFSAGLTIGLARPDLVVLDLTMRNLDGFLMAEDLRARQETNGIPLLAITGTKENKRGSSPFDEIVQKPFDADVLKQKIDAALRARKVAA